MLRSISILASTLVVACVLCSCETADAQQPRAFGKTWGGGYSSLNWDRFYHYPYVYYPQNYWGNEYYRSVESLYYRYPKEMRIPVYNKRWHNPYPSPRRYHSGHQFYTDIF